MNNPSAPFDVQIVSDPRRVGSSVESLHRGAFERLLREFEVLLRGAPPRPAQTLPGARLVLSEQHGFGKSHLLGRLFAALDERATCVYLTPFVDPDRCWQSLLLATMLELERGRPVPQLEAFASYLFLTLLDHCESARRDPEGVHAAMTQASMTRAGRFSIDAWLTWLGEGLLEELPGALRWLGFDLEPSNRAWIRVLYHYAHAPRDSVRRLDCVDWLRVRPLEEAPQRALGLYPFEGVDPTLSSVAINHQCRARLSGLCALAAFFRPFLFCFDQTESFGHDPMIARKFGQVVSELVSASGPSGPTFPQQMTIVTANRLDWAHGLLPHIVPAESQRLRPDDPIVLGPPTQEDARALVEARLLSQEIPVEVVRDFLDRGWFEQFFTQAAHRGGKEAEGTRAFLIECQKQWAGWERLDASFDDEVTDAPSEPVGPALGSPSIEARFDAQRQALLDEKNARRYDEDCFVWFVDHLAKNFDGVKVEKNNDQKYFNRSWSIEGRGRIFFSFEGGKHHGRWRALRNEAEKIYKTYPGAKAVVFRTAELEVLPGNWKDAELFRDATKIFLDVFVLTDAQTTALYAARRVAKNVGDDAEALLSALAFFVDRLSALRCRVIGSLSAEVVKKSSAPPERAPTARQLSIPTVVAGAAEQETAADSASKGSAGGWRTLSVTELSALCEDTTRRERFFASVTSDDEAGPSKKIFNEAPSPMKLGERFHRAVFLLVTLLCRGESWTPEPGSDAETLWQFCRLRICPQVLKGHTLTSSVRAILFTALRAFCARLAELGQGLSSGAGWSSLYVSSEQPISASLGVAGIRVRGRVDAIRRVPDGIEIVDYKLAQGKTQRGERDLLQLAIYAVLFEASLPGTLRRGVLEYYHPQLRAHEVSLEKLKAIFDQRVRPILDTLREHSPKREAPQDPVREMGLGADIVRALAQFDVDVEVIASVEAPQVVRYHLRPKGKTSVRQIANRAGDLQVKLGLVRHPLIKNAAGAVHLDIPKPRPDTVFWSSLQEEETTQEAHTSPLAFPLGVSTDNDVLIADLSESTTCHMLVAGCSGSGKSEFLKSLLASLATKNSPEGLRMLLIDPKRVTFGQLKTSAYLTHPVIHDGVDAVQALTDVVIEMERRYKKLAEFNHENITQARRSAAKDAVGPFLLIVVDEFADVVVALEKKQRQKFEANVTRIAQKGRAAGVHLILTTQNPIRTVVTSLVKSNLPLKVCFQVTSGRTSMNVLDEPGAEHLVGRGDFLVRLDGRSRRAQAPLIAQAQLLRALGAD